MKSYKITAEKWIYKEVINNIKNYLELVLAFSGGLDSTVLLDVLHNINNQKNKLQNNHIKQLFKFRAIHIHHGLSHYANYWAQHCAKECQKRNIPFNFIKIYCNKNNHQGGIENTARQMRYEHLLNDLQPKEILLTAHHLDDQSETFFLALKRGSGPKGLSGMPKKKYIYKHQLLRPLLQCSKKQIKQYAQNKKLTWITDDNNINTRFDRNFLRLDIFPILQNRWPNINYNIARSAQLCAEQEKLLDELLKEELNKLYCCDHSLLLKPLTHMSLEKRQALLRRWLDKFNIQMPSHQRLYHIWKNVILSKKDAIPIIQLNKQFSIRRFQNRLFIVSIALERSLNNIVINWNNIKTNILLPNELGILVSKPLHQTKNNLFNKKKPQPEITVLSQNSLLYTPPYSTNINKMLNSSLIRAPHEKEIITIRFNYISNDKIYTLRNPCRKKIKKIWQELKIPPWVRKNIPLLFYNNKLIAALGAFITQEGNIKNTDTGLKIYWIQKTKN